MRKEDRKYRNKQKVKRALKGAGLWIVGFIIFAVIVVIAIILGYIWIAVGVPGSFLLRRHGSDERILIPLVVLTMIGTGGLGATGTLKDEKYKTIRDLLVILGALLIMGAMIGLAFFIYFSFM